MLVFFYNYGVKRWFVLVLYVVFRFVLNVIIVNVVFYFFIIVFFFKVIFVYWYYGGCYLYNGDDVNYGY